MDDSRKLDRTWLCSVLFSDIVNYSSQSVELQMRWKGFFNDVLSGALRSVPVDDRVVLDTGDGAAIAFLGDPEPAFACALALRSAYVTATAEDPANAAIRLGINLGPVKLVRDINGNLNALGDGINVAQRIMSFAGPNQILVSRSFFDVISRLSDDYKRLFRYDGVRQDKHVREHTVYELAPAGDGVAAATVVEPPPASNATAPLPVVVAPGPMRAPSKLGMWLGGGALALVLVLLMALLVTRQKPQAPAATPSSESSAAASKAPVEAPSQTTLPAPSKPQQQPVTSAAVHTAGSESRKSMPAQPSVTPMPQTPAPTAPSIPAPNIPSTTIDVAGRWQADVKYSWGPTHTESFDFKVDGNEIFGTASYVRTARAITDGKLEGNKITFTTKSQTMLGEKTYDEKHAYRGRITGDVIEFMLQTDSGYDTRPPEMFTARRVQPNAAAGK